MFRGGRERETNSNDDVNMNETMVLTDCDASVAADKSQTNRNNRNKTIKVTFIHLGPLTERNFTPFSRRTCYMALVTIK